MSASLKMFQICRNCIKCFNSANYLTDGSPRHIKQFVKLRYISSSSKLLSNKDESDTDESDAEGSTDKKLESAVDTLSKTIPGDQGKGIKLDLISKLQSIRKPESQEQKAQSLGNLLKNMSVFQQEENRRRRTEQYVPGSWRDQLANLKKKQNKIEDGQQVADNRFQQSDQQQQPGRKPFYRVQGLDKNYKLFDGPRLGIFSPEDMESTVTEGKETLWDVVENEKKLLMESIPHSGFDEMMMMTKQGKLWKFPIDNEQDWELEKNTAFHEHVFLDHLIEDFPKKGPLRHFMDVVVVALSKNAFLTAQQKKDHIQWFREYFTEKKDILVETLGENGIIEQTEQQALKAESVTSAN